MGCFEELNKMLLFSTPSPSQQGLVNAVFIVAIVVLFVWVYSLCREIHEGMCDDTFKSGYGYGARLEQIAEGGLGTTGETVYGSIGSTMPGKGGLSSDVYSEKGSVSPFLGGPEPPVFYVAGNEQYIANQQNKRLASEASGKDVNTAFMPNSLQTEDNPVKNYRNYKQDKAFYEYCGKNPNIMECGLWKYKYCAADENKTKRVCAATPEWVEGMRTDDRVLLNQ
jgi:hypothetical protein